MARITVVACCLGLFVWFWSGHLSAQHPLEVVAELQQAPGNITVTFNSRVIVSLHQFFEPSIRVAELTEDGKLAPFPDAAWSTGGDATHIALDSVLGIRTDDRGRVWMLDNGLRGGTVPKLVAWDLRENLLTDVIHLPAPVTLKDSFVNDLAVDDVHQAIYIADPAGGNDAAIIVVDRTTGMAWRVLQGDRSVIPEPIDLVIDGTPVRVKRPDGEVVRPHIGVNPIALDPTDEWLYFGPMHGTSLYRVRTEDLLNRRLTPAELAARVQRYSDKPICDGITIDAAENIYVTDLAAHAVGVIDRDRNYRILVSDPRLSWPDAFSFSPDDYVYVVANQLNLSAPLNAGKDSAKPPFYILRFRALSRGVTGR